MTTHRIATSGLGALVAGGLALLSIVPAHAHGGSLAHGGSTVIDVPAANPRTGVQGNVLTPSATQTSVAWGALPLVNPDTANGVTHYGYNTQAGGPLTQAPDEAFKTEAVRLGA